MMISENVGASCWLLCALVWIGPAEGSDVEGEIELGLGHLSDYAYRFGNTAGVNEQGLAPLLDLSVGARPAGEETGYWQLNIERALLDTTRLELEVGQQGDQRLRLNYRETPNYGYDDALTPVRSEASSTLVLPEGWEASDATTAGMAQLEESLSAVNLWQQRRSLGLDYRKRLGQRWTLDADFRRETLEGTRALGGATGATGGNVRALLLPAPVDDETHIAALNLSYVGDGYHWRIGYHGSFYSNQSPELVWQTPFGSHPQWGPDVGYPDGYNRMAQAPDNQAHQLRAQGGLTLTRTTRLHLDAALGRQSQDQVFLPYTINPNLEAPEPLPRDSLNSRVDTTHLRARLTSRPAPRVNLVTRLGYRDRDNRTPIDAYQRVRGDAVAQQAPIDARLNRPYGLTETRASTDVAYRLTRGTRLEAGYEFQETRRDYSEVARTGEHGVKLGVRSTRFESLAIALNYHQQRRSASEYRGNQPLVDTHIPGSIDAEDFENHPLLRKYYLTDRDRDQWRLRTDWYPAQALTLGVALAHSQDRYPSGYMGLNRAQMVSATLDASYAPGDDWRLSGFVNRDQYRRTQSGRSFRGSVPADAFDPERDWKTRGEDRFNVVGLSLDWERLRPRLGDWQPEGDLSLRLSATRSHSRGAVDTQAGPALDAAPLPDLITRLSSFEMEALYQLSERASVRLGLEREHYRSRDFALDEIAPDAVNTVLLMGYSSPTYRVTWVRLGYRYSF